MIPGGAIHALAILGLVVGAGLVLTGCLTNMGWADHRGPRTGKVQGAAGAAILFLSFVTLKGLWP